MRLDRLVDLLGRDQLSKALENQGEIGQDLRSLLELLLSENRAKRIESEKARYRKYLERINRLIQEQKEVQGRTAGGDDPKQLSGQQGGLADKTAKLSKEINAAEEANAGQKKGEKGANGEKGEKGGESPKAQDGQKGQESQKGQGSPKSQEDQKGQSGQEGKKGQEGQKGQGSPKGQKGGKSQQGQEGQPGQPGSGEPSEQDQQQSQDQQPNPVRKRLEAAEERMKEAQKRLDEAKRTGALDEQEKALRELEKAKAELEEILRQLREEETKRLLAMLEARFQKMLAMQREIYEGTVRLDKVPSAERTHNHEIEAGRLSGQETEILVEVDRALLLLREEGSAVALPEAVQQMREDVQQVVHRLAQDKVDTITQTVERDIIAALEEILDALKKAQKDSDKKKASRSSRSGEPQDPPLIEMLAELKMIRALQMRVNHRTERYAKLVQGEQADKQDLLEALQRLSEQQKRIYRVTRDLELGKNQ